MQEAAIHHLQLSLEETTHLHAQHGLESTTISEAGDMLNKAVTRIKYEAMRAYYLHLTPDNVSKVQNTIALGITAAAITGGIINTIKANTDLFEVLNNGLHGLGDKVSHILGWDHGSSGPDHTNSLGLQIDPTPDCPSLDHLIVSGPDRTLEQIFQGHYGRTWTTQEMTDFMNAQLNRGGLTATDMIGQKVIPEGTCLVLPEGIEISVATPVPVNTTAAPIDLAPIVDVPVDSTDFWNGVRQYIAVHPQLETVLKRVDASFGPYDSVGTGGKALILTTILTVCSAPLLLANKLGMFSWVYRNKRMQGVMYPPLGQMPQMPHNHDAGLRRMPRIRVDQRGVEWYLEGNQWFKRFSSIMWDEDYGVEVYEDHLTGKVYWRYDESQQWNLWS